MKRKRAREMDIIIGSMNPGKYNAITDVEGVGVGHSTIIKGEGPLVPGVGPIRTGVTAITPHNREIFTEKVPAAVYIYNAFGKSLGLDQVRHMGVLETPILSTDTWNVWKVADGLFDYMHERYNVKPTSVNPVVGETQGRFLNDSYGRHVGKKEVYEALDEARSPSGRGKVEEGNIGGGTPMSGYGFKGGIGTASRKTDWFTLGVLTQVNFGRREDLLINGVPVGKELKYYESSLDPLREGSCMIYIAIDLDLTCRQLKKVAKRAMLGLARTGSYGGTTSGDYVLAFSTRRNEVQNLHINTFKKIQKQYPELTLEHMPESAEVWLNPVYRATVEATEEAVINAMFKAETMVGRDDNTRHGIPLDQIVEIMEKYGRY
jgi:D-aminopeptidase